MKKSNDLRDHVKNINTMIDDIQKLFYSRDIPSDREAHFELGQLSHYVWNLVSQIIEEEE